MYSHLARKDGLESIGKTGLSRGFESLLLGHPSIKECGCLVSLLDTSVTVENKRDQDVEVGKEAKL